MKALKKRNILNCVVHFSVKVYFYIIVMFVELIKYTAAKNKMQTLFFTLLEIFPSINGNFLTRVLSGLIRL